MSDDAIARFRTLLLRHVARYPRGGVQDSYKLMFQGCCGPEHAASAEAEQRLRDEAATLAEIDLEPVLEALPPDGAFVRVHLRPYLARGGTLATLAGAFVRSATPVPAGRTQLGAWWGQVVALAQAELLPFSAVEAREFGRVMAERGYPAARHSAGFADAYAPAYRVLSAAEAAILFDSGR